MADTGKIKAVVYIRLARENNTAFEMQKETVLRYAVENGYGEYSNIPVYGDNGASGNSFERTGFTQMMSDINNGGINLVIVKSINRISRDLATTGLWVEDMRKKGVMVKTVDKLHDSGFSQMYEDMRRFVAKEHEEQRRACHDKSANKSSEAQQKGGVSNAP